ncbi:MAG: hypothetical protein HY337_02930 [Gemmatimonadetes bacterium]|nr:hypothetical protein [Gemmatimonadota bacterium]
MTFIVSPGWKAAYPGAVVGVLAMRDVVNPPHHPALEARKQELESQLRSRFAGLDRTALRAALPALEAYLAYYKRLGSSYHVQHQLESIAWKGRSLPRVAALVEAMFTAELKNALLTAGHDLAAVELPARLDVATGTERYVRLNGQEQQLKPGDMMISDARAVISSVLYGPDYRTRITPDTVRVLFTVYAPAGIPGKVVREHLTDIQANVALIAPAAQVESMDLYPA